MLCARGVLTLKQIRESYGDIEHLLDVEGKITIWERAIQNARLLRDNIREYFKPAPVNLDLVRSFRAEEFGGMHAGYELKSVMKEESKRYGSTSNLIEESR
jgi:hypothetical protein